MSDASVMSTTQMQALCNQHLCHEEFLQSHEDAMELAYRHLQNNGEVETWGQLRELILMEKDDFQNKNEEQLKDEQNKKQLEKAREATKLWNIGRFYPSDQIDIKSNGHDKGVKISTKGAIGHLYEAYDSVLTPMALKLILPQNKDKFTNAELDKFRKECKIMMLAAHPNIVQYLGWTSRMGALGILMEYLPGGNLHDFLLGGEKKSIQLVMKLQFIADIACGLAYLHTCFTTDPNIVHGDIKLLNILLSCDAHCKLCDFGGAACCDDLSSTSTGGSYEFTSIYAPPERLKNNQLKPTKEMDVFSFGILMLTILLSEFPWIGQDLTTHLQAIIRGQRPVLCGTQNFHFETDKMIIELLNKLIQNCWHQNPNQRHKMQELSSKIRDHLSMIQNNPDIEFNKKRLDTLQQLAIVTYQPKSSICKLDQMQLF
ncbi:uncharacterized protein LOC143445113 isoform X2 [Clavelina lepadiformis]|uniref:uncharacterized protein LOC143445113 isoform X2 n=1 Tax=Clavelina lepadiformis TaxID=159417 RepID=UPI004042B30B